ncbi:hypothetical protein MLC59_11975 [Marinobacter bryozoorum]|uniref:hypothetical protein n=1 Tax=Marinobacter bryozoorum TaxID=256324 RepID=UPI002003AE93|nr:hypothetical protein [Marinobacter bryozoorum]MCK7544879.1 hypothetical protein [Marinobacter bryozoorum]
MEIHFTIKGSDDEVLSFFERFVGEARAEALVQALDEAGAISREELAEDPIYELLDQVSWKTYYLCHILLVEDLPDGEGNYSLPYDYLEATWQLSDRSIASRIGGNVKIAQRLGIDPILSMRKRQNARYCILSREAAAVLQYTLTEWDKYYREWLAEEGLDYPEHQI